jgi:dephospho-CoA kinase
MTKIIGLTGGIGSGKTTIGNYFRSLGIPVYVADEEGRKLTDSAAVLLQIESVFGGTVFDHGKLNRKKISEIVFNNPEQLQKLNNIIHPAVKKHFGNWVEQYKDQPLVVRESAILFESGSYQDCDYIITVTAPVEERIARVMQRDRLSKEAVSDRIKNQMSDEERISKSDFVIQNTNLQYAEKQAEEILKKL